MKLRFTIRDLLWLSALAAVCVGWFVDHHFSIQKWSRVHYWVDAGTYQVHFSRGDTVDGAHMFQGTVEFPD